AGSPLTAPCGVGLGAFPVKPPFGDPLHAAADYLGLTADQLAQGLQDGRTLADVATAQGKSVAGLEQALRASAKARLGRSVAAGTMTAAEEQQVLDQLRGQIDGFVTGQGALAVRIDSGPTGPDPLATAAGYLGLSEDELRQELQPGKSLADVATEHGKSV